MNSAPRRGGFSLAGLFLPAGLLMGWIGWRFRRRNAAIFTALVVLALSSVMFVSGCGGFSQKSAAPGTYTIQITGVGTNSNITHYQTISVTITK
jgi:biotin transporter BioY